MRSDEETAKRLVGQAREREGFNKGSRIGTHETGDAGDEDGLFSFRHVYTMRYLLSIYHFQMTTHCLPRIDEHRFPSSYISTTLTRKFQPFGAIRRHRHLILYSLGLSFTLRRSILSIAFHVRRSERRYVPLSTTVSLTRHLVRS